MGSPFVPEGLRVFLRHAKSLHPSNNVRRENGFAKEFQVFYVYISAVFLLESYFLIA